MVDLDDARSRAARVAACAELRDVRLFGVQAHLGDLPSDAQVMLRYSYNARIEVQQLMDENTLIVDGTYDVAVGHSAGAADDNESEGQLPDIAESSGDEVARVEFHFAALYELARDDVTAFPEEELHAFGQTTGLLALHPYAREFVSTITGRMGLPPLHIGTAHIYLDKRNDGHD